METSLRQKIADAATKVLPELLGQTPFVGDAAKEILNSLGYNQHIADSYLNSLLRNLSNLVDQKFLSDGIGLEGGLSYSMSGTEKSNFIVSRAVAAYLNSITDPDQEPLTLKSLVIALLHERMWQCKDSEALYNTYSVMPLYEGISAIQKRLQLIVVLAIQVRNTTLDAISKYEPAATLFEKNNMHVSIENYTDTVRGRDIFDERAQAECVELSTNPCMLIERYLDLFNQKARSNIHYIPYLKPFIPPSKEHPPMLKSIRVPNENFISPGLAVESIVVIKPYRFLDMNSSSNDDRGWPYGKEIEAGYINLNPPFEMWCDQGQGNTNRPAWIENDRTPDLVSVFERHSEPTVQQWSEYVQSSTNNFEM